MLYVNFFLLCVFVFCFFFFFQAEDGIRDRDVTGVQTCALPILSASTEEMTATCQDLTKRAADQAQLVRAAADDAAKILHIATALAAGAEDSVRRNTAVADLARRHKEVLDQSTAQLAKLAEEVERGSKEGAALAQASGEIQKFVT